WGVFSVPAGTPKEVVSKLTAALNAGMASPDIQQQIIKLGMIPPGPLSHEELERFIASEIARRGKVVRQAGAARGGMGGAERMASPRKRGPIYPTPVVMDPLARGRQETGQPHKNRVGHISVRHMCDDGVLSKPSPSFGCLKLRPMMSTKLSRLTTALGSNE